MLPSCTGNILLPILSAILAVSSQEWSHCKVWWQAHSSALFCRSEGNQLERTQCLLPCAKSSLQLMLMKPNCQKHNVQQQLVYESWDPIQFMGKSELVVSLSFSWTVCVFCFVSFPGKHQKLLQNCRSTKTIWKHWSQTSLVPALPHF